MVALPTPFEAYRLDLGRLGVEDELCAADSMWLLVAHCLSRFADQPETARLDLAERCALALEQFAASAQEAVELDGVTPLDEASLGELARLIDGLRRYRNREGHELLAKTAMDMALRMSDFGANTLASTVLAHAREAVHLAGARTRGQLLAEQARFTRMLGDLDTADALYGQVHAMGERLHDEFLLARSALGRGVVARVRGNYPSAKTFFTDALTLSERVKSGELQRLAHQGLTISAAVAEDWEEALRHGWLTLVHAAGNSRFECEALVNLAHISLGAGYSRAALHAILKAMPNAADEHARLPALGTAVVAAARCDEHSLVEHLAVQLEGTAANSSTPYEAARALLSLSDAYYEIGFSTRGNTTRARALEIAEKHHYHELIHVAEKEVARPVVNETRELQGDGLEVVSKLESLEYELVF